MLVDPDPLRLSNLQTTPPILFYGPPFSAPSTPLARPNLEFQPGTYRLLRGLRSIPILLPDRRLRY